jgi:bla regulator protein blaR1
MYSINRLFALLVSALLSTIAIDAQGQSVQTLKVEAEDMKITGSVKRDKDKEGNTYIYWVKDSRTPDKAEGSISYTFNVDKAGTYHIWGRFLIADHHTDSLYVKINNSDESWTTAENKAYLPASKEVPNWISWNLINKDVYNKWGWSHVAFYSITNPDRKPVKFHLKAGKQTITIAGREPNTKLDKLIITNNLDFVPTDEPTKKSLTKKN